MCGIFGYIGPRKAIEVVLKGIKKLEYRGYDSAGVAWIEKGELHCQKKLGKITVLEESIDVVGEDIAIAHTRWATHGKPSDLNAHPHFDQHQALMLVHNGIIENHEELREMLKNKGVKFQSETDSEVIVQLIAYLYKGDLLKAVQKSISLLKGSYALAMIHKKHPGTIVCVAKESPLALGQGEGEAFIASDCSAFLEYTKKAVYLHSGEIALVSKKRIQTFDAKAYPIFKEVEEISHELKNASKKGYAHFMLKEINEQDQTVLNAFYGRVSKAYGTAILEELKSLDQELLDVERIIVVACGTSFHAGMVAGYLFGERARIPVEVEISSEFRYKNPIVRPKTLAIAISQSGETADTLAAMKELKRKGAKLIGICNVQGSSVAREVDACLFLKAGPEIGVASTKAFTSQVIVLSLLALKLARSRAMRKSDGEKFITKLLELPNQLKQILDKQKEIQKLAQKYAHFENMFFFGRRFMYPTALEGALKLKEIAYVNANGYPAGEMKHGPIALINEKCPTVAFCCDSITYPKILSNMMEVKARSGKILAVTFENDTQVKKIADDVFYLPETLNDLATVSATLFSQLFAYYVALERKTEIDQPRNLAKSVTVE